MRRSFLKKCFGILFFVPILNAISSSEMNDERREVIIGESFDLKMTAGKHLSLPKRSLVEVAKVDDDLVRITALKSGFEIIQILGPKGSVDSRILLDIKKNRETCRGNCNMHGDRMIGETDVVGDWLDNADWCRKRRCQFEQKLSRKGKQNLLYLLKDFDLRVTDLRMMGSLRIEVIFKCSGAPLAENIQHLLKGFQIISRCELQSTENYRLRAKVILVDESDLQHMGVDWTTVDVFQDSFAINYENLRRQQHAVTIGEPEAMIMVGESVYLHSGGEIHSSDRQSDHWKTHGLELEAHLQRHQDQQLTLATDLKLSSPKEGRHLQSYQLKSKLITEPQVTVYAGRTSIESNHRAETSFMGLDAIPILGPILKHQSQTVMKQWICLWLKLEVLPIKSSAAQ